jgi:RND superfamily putative drug exporter
VDGVTQVSPAVPNDPQLPTAVLWRVVPATSPQDQATTDLLHTLRSDIVPPINEAVGTDILITSPVAANVDFSDYLSERIRYFYGAVLLISFLFLMAVFRSVLVPLKAVLMNLLAIGAAYGIVVAVFQWGWGGSILGIEPGPIEPFIPMMLFAIVFGLSMDYEVFLLTRIREEYDRSGNNSQAVADGLAATARVITAAALIMVFVFGSFILEDLRTIKVLGLGLAAAVAIDATIVRMLLVPATMELLGDKNWWIPKWLDRILPNLIVEPDRPQHRILNQSWPSNRFELLDGFTNPCDAGSTLKAYAHADVRTRRCPRRNREKCFHTRTVLRPRLRICHNAGRCADPR